MGGRVCRSGADVIVFRDTNFDRRHAVVERQVQAVFAFALGKRADEGGLRFGGDRFADGDPPPRAVVGAAVGMALLGALAPVSRISRVDPATVYRG